MTRVPIKKNRSHSALIALFAILVLGAGSSSGSEGPTDSQITAWIQEQLTQDPRVNPGKVEVATNSGIVTLGGTVPTLAGKKYADLESKKIRGVRGVINEIIVSPVLRSDKEISRDVMRRFQNSADLNQSAVAAESLEGKVFLSGKVDSWSKREQAECLAAEVRGVRLVVNEVQIQYQEKRRDDEIEKDVASTIKRDVYLCGFPIRVSVVEGVVTLQGSVTGPYEKDRASSDALSVDNVKKVDNRLGIVGGEPPIREKAPRPPDDELRRSIREELSQDLRTVSPYELDIEVVNGNVTLRGLAWSLYERRLAIEDTRDVVGVGRVEDLLAVYPELREDRAIRDDLQFEIGLDSVLNNQDLGIRVAGGMVTLTGKVDTFYEKLHAGEVVSRVRGVRELVNAIQVTGAPMFSDAAVQDAVKRRLEANMLTGPAAGRISVKVEKGRATLAGEVDTWTQYREAARVALLTKGVRSLDNQLNLAGAQFH